MDHPLSHQVLVNRQMRTPIDSSLARSHYKKICKIFCWNQWPSPVLGAHLERVTQPLACVRAGLKHLKKSRALWGFYFFAKLVHPS